MHDSIDNLISVKNNIANKLSSLQFYFGNAFKSFNNKNDEKFNYQKDENTLDDFYFRRISSTLNDNAEDFKTIIDSVHYASQLLGGITKEREIQKSMTLKEQKQVKNLLVSESTQLQTIRKDKTKLTKELSDKKKSAARISSLISNLVKKDIERQNKLAQSSKPSATKPPKSGSGKNSKSESAKSEPSRGEIVNPKIGPANLSWPSSSHKLLRKYGIYTNAETNVKIENPGIDIACPKGSSANSAGDGIVSYVDWMPGFGHIVIVDHQNGWRTVYANLTSVSVSNNQKVKKGSLIGKTGASEEGEYLHFEVYKGRNRMNPQGVF